MGFLRRLLGAPRQPDTPSTTPVGRTRDHPNAARPGPIPSQGSPERWRFEVPDGIAVLNAKTRNVVHTVRLDHSDPDVLAAVAGPKGRGLVPTDLRSDGQGVAVYSDDARLGLLPAHVAQRFAPLVRDYEARGWRLVTWTDVLPPDMSIAQGGSRSGPSLVAEVRLPTEDEPLFADAYDASFAFPTKLVMARRNTPEGKAEHDAWVASQPVRETVIVRVGEVAVRASRCAWEAFGDHTMESRGLRLKDEMSVWLPLGEVGDALEARGARIIEVAGVTHHPDHTAPAFAAEQPVSLVPEPTNPYDPNAIAIRSADGRLMAGYVPRDDAARMHRKGGSWTAMVIWEYRHTGREGDRAGLRLLIAHEPISVEGVR